MSTFSTSRGTRGQHVQPKWTSAPSHPCAHVKRQFIHGKVRPLEQPRRLDAFSRVIVLALFGVAAVLSAKYGWQW